MWVTAAPGEERVPGPAGVPTALLPPRPALGHGRPTQAASSAQGRPTQVCRRRCQHPTCHWAPEPRVPRPCGARRPTYPTLASSQVGSGPQAATPALAARPPPVSWPFTRRASRAAAGSVVVGGGAGWRCRRLGRAPQEGRHELGGVDVGHEGFGVDVELPAEGRAEVFTLGLRRRRRQGATGAAARAQPGGFHVRLVPAVGRRVAAAAAAAAPAAAAATAATTARIHDRGGRVCGEERAGNGGGGDRLGRSRPH